MNRNKKRTLTKVTAIALAATLASGSVTMGSQAASLMAANRISAGAISYSKTLPKDGQLSTGITAGAIAKLYSVPTQITVTDIEPEIVEEVSKLLEPVVSVESIEATKSEWDNKLMSSIEESVNVRMEASVDSERVGKLSKGDLAEIVETVDGWYKIASGNLEGYISAEFCVVGEAARQLSEEVCKQYAVATADGLRVREEPSTEAAIVTIVDEKDKIELGDAEDIIDEEGWVAVSTKDGKGFVHSDFVEIETVYGKGMTVEEEAEAIAAAKAAEAAAEAEAQKKKTAAVAASTDDVTLLGALIQCEAGGGSYDGMVAVGAVVVNRMKRGYAGGSLRGVIYQPGQFPPATSGKMDRILSSGVSGSCISAAQEALSGVDNTGGAVGFRAASSGYGGVVIGGNVFY